MKRRIFSALLLLMFMGSFTSAYATWYCCGADPCDYVDDGSDDIIMGDGTVIEM